MRPEQRRGVGVHEEESPRLFFCASPRDESRRSGSASGGRVSVRALRGAVRSHPRANECLQSLFSLFFFSPSNCKLTVLT